MLRVREKLLVDILFSDFLVECSEIFGEIPLFLLRDIYAAFLPVALEIQPYKVRELVPDTCSDVLLALYAADRDVAVILRCGSARRLW